MNNMKTEFTIEELKKHTIEKMALYRPGERPKGEPQELDRLIIDTVQIRASHAALEKAITDEQAQSIIFQNYLIGTVYSVGIKLRKLLDKQNGVLSLNSIWELWEKNTEARQILVELSSEEEVSYIWKTLKSPDKSKYKTAWKYLQIVLSHNQEIGQNQVKWADIDELLCFAVRTWHLLVKATDNFYGFGTYLRWDNANSTIDELLNGEQREKMKDAWNTYCHNAEHWHNFPCNEYS